MKTACFILGMHRSGTSALGGVLSILGMEFGTDLMSANEGNPKGYFENNFIYKLNEKILFESNSSWDDIYFDIDSIKRNDFEMYVGKAEEILINEFRYVEKFVIKDPRISLLFPIWEKACKNLGYDIKIILPYRNPLEVAKSLQKRNNFSIEKGLLLWSKHVLEAEKFSRDYQHMSTTFSELIDEPVKTIKVLANFLDIDISKNTKKDVISFLDKKIKHNNISLQNVSKELPMFLSKLIKLIKKEDFDNTEKFDSLRKEFYFSLSLFHNDDVRQKLALYKVLGKKLKVLEENNKLLDKIKDTTLFDEEYYSSKYLDLKKYKGSLLKHYIEHGNAEGRYPNEYSQINNIDQKGHLPTNILLEKKEYEILSLQQNVAKLESSLDSVKKQYNEVNTSLQKEQKEHNKIAKQKEKLEEDVKEKTKQILSLQQNIAKLESSLDSVKKQYNEVNASLQKEQKNIQSLILQRDKYKKELLIKEKNIKELSKSLDEIVEDLATIKESKCWIYTKPLRDLHKSIKG